MPDPDTEATFKNLSAVTFPVGNLSSYDCPELCGGDVSLIPWELDSQLS